MGSAIKIKEQSNFYTEIIYIEDYIMNKKKIENSIIYFLCNSDLVKEVFSIDQPILYSVVQGIGAGSIILFFLMVNIN